MMGTAPSTPFPRFGKSVVVEAGSGDSGDVRRQADYKDELRRTAVPGMLTLYDVWQ